MPRLVFVEVFDCQSAQQIIQAAAMPIVIRVNKSPALVPNAL